MGQIYKLDFGGSSPFQAFSAAGDVMFDSRYSVLLKHMSSHVSIPPRNPNLPPNYADGGTNAFATIPYNKTFARPPAFCVLHRALSGQGHYSVDGYYSSYLGIVETGLPSQSWGSSATSKVGQLDIGNFEIAGSHTFYFIIFENTVQG